MCDRRFGAHIRRRCKEAEKPDGAYQPADGSPRAAVALAAFLRASLRLSRRHCSRLSRRTSVGKKAMRMNPAFVMTLSLVSP